MSPDAGLNHHTCESAATMIRAAELAIRDLDDFFGCDTGRSFSITGSEFHRLFLRDQCDLSHREADRRNSRCQTSIRFRTLLC